MTSKQVPELGYAMPRFGPLYSAPPFVYEGNRTVNVVLRTRPDVLQGLVPKPMTPNAEGLLFIYVADFRVTKPLPFGYKEAGVGVPVTLTNHPGNYGVVLYLDHTTAIVAGREIYGFPKKPAEITFDEERDHVVARVTRDGVVLIDTTVQKSERVDPVPSQQPVPWYNLKLIPSVKQGAPPDVMQLTATLTEGTTQVLYRGPTTLTLGTSPNDPLGNIPVLEIVQGGFSVGVMTLGFGDVAYDYLTEGD